MTSTALDPARDPAIDRRSRGFLRELNRDSSAFWTLPGDEPRRIVTALQDQTPVDLSGIEVEERVIPIGGRGVTLYVVRPEGATGGAPGVHVLPRRRLDRRQLREPRAAGP